MKRLLSLLVLTGLVLAATWVRAEPDTLPVLRRKLLEARSTKGIGHALDQLTTKIGETDFFEDHDAFGDWLGTLPDGRADHPLVRLRRGWAYVRTKRAEEAIPHLEAALKDDPGDGLRRAYLGEALRQTGKLKEAAEMLTTARRTGHTGKHLDESFRETVFGLRAAQISGHAEDLPDFVGAIEQWLAVKPDPLWHHTLARLLLDDMAIFEKPDRTRGKSWARVAGRHALLALERSTTPPAGSGKLTYDAVTALEILDAETEGRTARYDLLVWAYRLDDVPAQDTHRRPQVITWLAEAAAAEGRFELAFRLASRRLEISESPRARRLLMRLPPDLDVE